MVVVVASARITRRKGKHGFSAAPDLNIFWEDCGRSIKRIAADVIPGLIFLRRFNKEGGNSFSLRVFKRNETSISRRGGCKLNAGSVALLILSFRDRFEFSVRCEMDRVVILSKKDFYCDQL